MNDMRCFEALDRTLRDRPFHLFGGKTVMLCVEFRQTLPVKKKKKKVSTNEIIASCVSESFLWPHFRIFFLKENMRLQRDIFNDDER